MNMELTLKKVMNLDESLMIDIYLILFAMMENKNILNLMTICNILEYFTILKSTLILI